MARTSATGERGHRRRIARAARRPDEVPALSASAEAWARPPSDQFRAGLDLLLDGIDSRLAAA